MLRVCVIGLGHIGNLHSRIYMEMQRTENNQTNFLGEHFLLLKLNIKLQ